MPEELGINFVIFRDMYVCIGGGGGGGEYLA